MKRRLISDISNIFSIRASILSKLVSLSESCICDYILETKWSDDDLLEIDIGIGKINMLISNDSVEYQFKPSSKLERSITNAVINNKNPLEKTLEEGIETRLLSTYKELF